MRVQSPADECALHNQNGDAFYFTKRVWRGVGYASPHIFDVLEHGPEWVKLIHTHDGQREIAPEDRRAFWITWREFGAFSIEGDFE